MLRILEHGMKVKMVPTKHQTFAVDTPDDLVRVEKIMREASGDSVKYEN
jgi:3-deoxy-manno-octulosonate cytidylyltransferase (CMP-KDO synthetase)